MNDNPDASNEEVTELLSFLLKKCREMKFYGETGKNDKIHRYIIKIC